jgi:hypothetical protein
MTPRYRRYDLTSRPFALTVELTNEEILEDLCWPGSSPGQWLANATGEAISPPPKIDAVDRLAA